MKLLKDSLTHFFANRQRFAISYLFVGLIILFVPKIQVPYNPASSGMMNDIYPYAFQWIAALILLLIHFLITFALEVPGCGRGYLGRSFLHIFFFFQKTKEINRSWWNWRFGIIF